MSADACTTCGSESLFSGFFDQDDLAVDGKGDEGSRWTTFCNDCGSEQPHPTG